MDACLKRAWENTRRKLGDSNVHALIRKAEFIRKLWGTAMEAKVQREKDDETEAALCMSLLLADKLHLQSLVMVDLQGSSSS